MNHSMSFNKQKVLFDRIIQCVYSNISVSFRFLLSFGLLLKQKICFLEEGIDDDDNTVANANSQ